MTSGSEVMWQKKWISRGLSMEVLQLYILMGIYLLVTFFLYACAQTKYEVITKKLLIDHHDSSLITI